MPYKGKNTGNTSCISGTNLWTVVMFFSKCVLKKATLISTAIGYFYPGNEHGSQRILDELKSTWPRATVKAFIKRKQLLDTIYFRLRNINDVETE